MRPFLLSIVALMTSGAVLAQSAEVDKTSNTSNEQPDPPGIIELVDAGPALSPVADSDSPIQFSMADIESDEKADAESRVDEANAQAKSLTKRAPDHRDSILYAEDWLAWRDAVKDLRGHSQWKAIIAPGLGAEPPSPTPSALEGALALRREEEAKAAERERRNEERLEREAAEARARKNAPPPYDAAREGERTPWRRRLDFYNQRTGFRHESLIQTCLRTGKDPWEFLRPLPGQDGFRD